MSRVFLIAECGSCHDGDPYKMQDLIRVAKEAGADAVKFQWCSSPEHLAERRHAQDYLDAYRTIAFPASALSWLKAQCDVAEIEFMCTVFLSEDIQEIAPLIKRFKVASYEATDQAFLQAHAPYQKGIIISHGMGQISGGFLTDYPISRQKFLHCVSAYPVPIKEMNLAVLGRNAHGEKNLDGLSDHSGHVLMGALAVAAGAEIIEVHFRLLSTSLHNPDYGHSLDPAQLTEYIANVRFAEAALGDGIKRCMPSEERWARYRVTAQ